MYIQGIIEIKKYDQGAKEGQWLQVDVEDDRILSAVIDETETAKA
jgi:hypothetical protein